MKQRRLFLITAGALFCSSAVMAQENHHHQPDAGETVGQVQFPISCSANARSEFNRAVAMLHSFWYEESEKAFAAITDKEPECAIGYWGIAMSLYHPLCAEAPNRFAICLIALAGFTAQPEPHRYLETEKKRKLSMKNCWRSASTPMAKGRRSWKLRLF